jgi:hypothetical protein
MNIKAILAIGLLMGVVGSAQAELSTYRLTAKIISSSIDSTYFDVGSNITVDYELSPYGNGFPGPFSGTVGSITFNGFSSSANDPGNTLYVYADRDGGYIQSNLTGRPDQVRSVSLDSRTDYPGYGSYFQKMLNEMSGHPSSAKLRFYFDDNKSVYAEGTSFSLLTVTAVPEVETSTSMLLGLSFLTFIGLRRKQY